MNLKGKIALVTGGGQGLGQQIVEVLASTGVLVVAADIKEEQVKKLERQLKGVTGVVLNVADEESVKQVFNFIKNKFGQLDILINNAGTDVTKSVDEVTTDEWLKVLKVNLVGPFLMSKQAFKIMGKVSIGQIVNVASTAAKRAWADASAYHASKWGLLGFSHALHVEGRRRNIKVTALVAGGMKTPFILNRFPEAEPNLQDPKNVAEIVKFVLTLPDETVIPEVMAIPVKETSWP